MLATTAVHTPCVSLVLCHSLDLLNAMMPQTTQAYTTGQLYTLKQPVRADTYAIYVLQQPAVAGGWQDRSSSCMQQLPSFSMHAAPLISV
jgi:hypothetical protein